MRVLVLVLFLAGAAGAQNAPNLPPPAEGQEGNTITRGVQPDPKPVMVDTPVPHWSCPAGYVAQVAKQTCHKYKLAHNRFMAKFDSGYDMDVFEPIEWEWDKTVLANGRLRIDYPTEFVKMPGCDVVDTTDPKTPLQFVDEGLIPGSSPKQWGVTIVSTPGHNFHLSCNGIIKRVL